MRDNGIPYFGLIHISTSPNRNFCKREKSTCGFEVDSFIFRTVSMLPPRKMNMTITVRGTNEILKWV